MTKGTLNITCGDINVSAPSTYWEEERPYGTLMHVTMGEIMHALIDLIRTYAVPHMEFRGEDGKIHILYNCDFHVR
jgi:hypothetical protein